MLIHVTLSDEDSPVQHLQVFAKPSSVEPLGTVRGMLFESPQEPVQKVYSTSPTDTQPVTGSLMTRLSVWRVHVAKIYFFQLNETYNISKHHSYGNMKSIANTRL